VQFCVLQAIELAVAEMIDKGISQGFWKPINGTNNGQGALLDAS
jgi:curli production assembly/transport component CsgG